MLELRKAILSDEYRKKWNIHENDFIHLYLDGNKVSDTLYRVGGLNGGIKDGYLSLIKHIESFYEDSITTIKKDKPHLAGHWCILNVLGVEKVIMGRFDYLSLLGGQIYSSKNNYYNIETGELYCSSYKSMNTEKYLFLHNEYDKDTNKRGVLKIDKYNGTFELIK